MLTENQKLAVSRQLNEKMEMLAYDAGRVSAETGMDAEELRSVLSMQGPYPGNVWKLRAYLDDMLRKEGIAPRWSGVLADPSANRWFSYDEPWRD